MPELPEVETVRRGLAELLPGRVVRAVTVFDSPKSFPNEPAQVEQFLYGASVVAVRRRAKVLLIELNTGYSLVVHLKMTGQLVFRRGARGSATPRGSPIRRWSAVRTPRRAPPGHRASIPPAAAARRRDPGRATRHPVRR